jgi:hypothetical protein
MAKKRKRTPALRDKRAWVPVAPDGYVLWSRASITRSLIPEAVERDYATLRWPDLEAVGWRIVRCRVEG